MTASFDEAMRRWADLPDAALDRAHVVFRPQQVPARTLLQRAGEPSRTVSFIVRGLTRIYYLDDGGTERTKAFRAEGDLVCAYSAALLDAPSAQYIEALEACDLLTADRPAFAALCAGEPMWGRVIAAMTERLFVDEERQRRTLLTDDATTRYRSFLTEQTELATRLTQRQIAAYVGVTPEALSRIRRLM